MEFRAKRELGEGRWDKILKRKLTELSVSDNYEEAKHEWIATGDVWWSGNSEQPDWVTHSGSCLCGHIVVYHFQILNTENNVIECVGSDHINTYLIMRAIAEDSNLNIDTITDEQIQEWIDVRTKAMKAEAWWAENGSSFELMFDAVKEIDLYYNIREGQQIYIPKYQWYEPSRLLRKRSEGQYGTDKYHMGSIVWRWNHENNPKAQINTTGIPNANLMKDLALLYIKSAPLIQGLEESKQNKVDRLKRLTHIKAKADFKRAETQRIYQERREEENRIYNLPENVEKRAKAAIELAEAERLRLLEREANIKRNNEVKRLRLIEETKLNTIALKETNNQFVNLCGYYGIPPFDESFAKNDWETKFLASIKQQLLADKPLSENQLRSLKPILGKDVPATEKQLNYLKALGCEDFQGSKTEASRKITELK